jgi:hypothetical protein
LNSALLNDGVYTETRRSCFNVKFKIAFKTIYLSLSWQIKKSSTVTRCVVSMYVEKSIFCVYKLGTKLKINSDFKLNLLNPTGHVIQQNV